ncbi:hypothetical protein [Aquiflexum lacus]|uniref:hypothetical protein n=1 Tax=Aquiflexum lacus TaxID=2483805 RepID=UPI001E5BEEC3|nr:hypothetical protein [Aquiflexum lacus]
MRFVNIILLLSIGMNPCNSQTQKKFKTAENRAAALKEYYEKVINSAGSEKPKYEQLFFEAFPSSFQEMQSVFGYDEEKGAAPMYYYNIELESEGKISIISFFYNLNYIDKEQHYNKYINICIGGQWDADNISEGFGIGAKLYNDTEAMASVLSKRTNKEIISAIRFVFDGPHPEQRKEYYEELYNKVKLVNSRISNLIKLAYEQLLAEDDCHGN